jgi:signal transduction histidine kinase
MTDHVTGEEKGSILVVDDTPINLKVLSNLLSDNGYHVRAARNGEMALMSVRSALPDLILLDVKMPGMDGYEVCNRLKAEDRTRDIPVMFISALNDTDNILRAFQTGGIDYITKPFIFEEVLARVEGQLTLVRQRQHIEMLREKDRQYFEALSRMKDRFVHSATHDLKSPLGIIVGYTSMIEDHCQDDPLLLDYVDAIKQAHKRMKRLITDMLDLAQMETGIDFTPSPVQLKLYLKNCLAPFEPLADQLGIKLVFSPPADDLIVPIDSFLMGRVFDNLLTNAIKYTPEGGRVELAVEVAADQVFIQVTDTGRGIAEEAIPRLFDAFYRVNTDQDDKEIEGSGLGLSIVKTIIEQHQGQITVDSAPGEGTTFHIALPLYETEPTANTRIL